MSFNQAISSVLASYADFKGRASAAEFWYWVVFLAIWTVVFAILGKALSALFWVLFLFFAVGVLLPTLSMTFRCKNAAGAAGWLYPLLMVPFIGMVVWAVEILAKAADAGFTV